VLSLDKPDYVRCKHLRRGGLKGCGIYKTRPEDCSIYQCLWLANPDALGVDFRPDRIGFVLSAAVFQVTDTEAQDADEIGGYVMIHETVPGSSWTPKAVELLKLISETVLVIEIQRDGIRKVRGGPPHLVERMVKIAAEMQEKGVPGFGFVKNK